MLNPNIGKLIRNRENRYGLVIEIARTARNISEKAHNDGEIIIEKPVTLAINELADKID